MNVDDETPKVDVHLLLSCRGLDRFRCDLATRVSKRIGRPHFGISLCDRIGRWVGDGSDRVGGIQSLMLAVGMARTAGEWWTEFGLFDNSTARAGLKKLDVDSSLWDSIIDDCRIFILLRWRRLWDDRHRDKGDSDSDEDDGSEKSSEEDEDALDGDEEEEDGSGSDTDDSR